MKGSDINGVQSFCVHAEITLVMMDFFGQKLIPVVDFRVVGSPLNLIYYKVRVLYFGQIIVIF